jgi:NAD(P)-dependent dehydrogenase (short-subunit alcohol dehydrogenase family)
MAPRAAAPSPDASLPWKGKLRGRVALVTGSSRGVGKGIALVLGEAGATVYVTGRTVRGHRSPLGVPGTIRDTAREVTERGGVGIPVRVDHSKTGRRNVSSKGSASGRAVSTFS